ncbi:MAG: hypothetical protein LBF22_05655 [Deltaproteobacteria bacterium]|jgi:hypothetical protein|nr:hypothetical protein [Deltaproteobacteria bacterium]
MNQEKNKRGQMPKKAWRVGQPQGYLEGNGRPKVTFASRDPGKESLYFPNQLGLRDLPTEFLSPERSAALRRFSEKLAALEEDSRREWRRELDQETKDFLNQPTPKLPETGFDKFWRLLTATPLKELFGKAADDPKTE